MYTAVKQTRYLLLLTVLTTLFFGGASSSVAGVDEGLVAYYPFNGNANDGSGHGNDGAVVEATPTTDRFGNPNSAYSFDGMRSHIFVRSNGNMELPGVYTITAWILPTSSSSDGSSILDMTTAGSSYGWVFETYGGLTAGTIRMDVAGGRVMSSISHSLNLWHHVAVTVDDGHVVFYLDGGENGQGTVASRPPNELGLFIGASHDLSHVFHGSIDEVRIYERALSEAEIAEIHGTLSSSLQYNLIVKKAGVRGGKGIVHSNDGNIDCGTACRSRYTPGQEVTLIAEVILPSTFIGWSGAGCSGTGPCVITLDGAKTVKATFGGPAKLTAARVRQTGGDGTVTSDPPAINCGSTCAAMYQLNTLVTLTAVASANSVFAGWSGSGCIGAGSCIISMDKAHAVKATFIGGDSAVPPVTVDWDLYHNWEVGRAWQYQTTSRDGTYSEYVKETGTKNGREVYFYGWSSNWSNQLNYWLKQSNGWYMVGYFDEDKNVDVFFSEPCFLLPNTFQPGRTYSTVCGVPVKIALDIVDNIEVPYGTFNQVAKATMRFGSDGRIHWFAMNVGQIRSYKVSSDQTDELLNITDGNTSQPPN